MGPLDFDDRGRTARGCGSTVAGRAFRRPRLRSHHAVGDPRRDARSTRLPGDVCEFLFKRVADGTEMSIATMRVVENIHEKHVANRRVEVLSRHLAELIPRDAAGIGCRLR